MKHTLVSLLVLAASFVMASATALAHHGNAAYDMDKQVPLKATITGFEYGNPHVQVFFDTTDDNGKVRHWNCEGTNPAMLTRMGWTKDTLKPGDHVTIIVHPNKNPDITVALMIKVILANGQVLESRNAI